MCDRGETAVYVKGVICMIEVRLVCDKDVTGVIQRCLTECDR